MRKLILSSAVAGLLVVPGVALAHNHRGDNPSNQTDTQSGLLSGDNNTESEKSDKKKVPEATADVNQTLPTIQQTDSQNSQNDSQGIEDGQNDNDVNEGADEQQGEDQNDAGEIEDQNSSDSNDDNSSSSNHNDALNNNDQDD